MCHLAKTCSLFDIPLTRASQSPENVYCSATVTANSPTVETASGQYEEYVTKIDGTAHLLNKCIYRWKCSGCKASNNNCPTVNQSLYLVELEGKNIVCTISGGLVIARCTEIHVCVRMSFFNRLVLKSTTGSSKIFDLVLNDIKSMAEKG